MKVRIKMRWIQYGLLVILLLIRFVIFGQTDFRCSDNLYQVVNGKDLKYLNPATGEYVTIGTSSINYNGAGYNVEDNYIYGIGSGTVLVRIDNTGEATNLGSISGFTALSYSGDFDTLGNWHSFRKANGNWLINVIDVSESPAVAVQYTATDIGSIASASNCADISYNAVSNKFYGMSSGLLTEFDPVNQTVRVIADYSAVASSGSYGAVWSDNGGNTYFFNNNTGNIYKAIINSSGEITSFGFTAVSAPNGMNDGMSCALGAPPVFPEICDNGLDDDGDGLVDCEDPDCTATSSCGVAAVIYGTEEACEGSIVTHHAFFTNNSTLSNTITITDILPTGYTFLQDTIEFDGGGSSDFSSQPAEGDQGTISWGQLTLNGKETVRISYDVLVGNGVQTGTVQNQITGTLSRASTAMFPSSLSTATDIMATCPPPNVFECEPAFYQVYKKRGKTEPNVYGKLDPVTGDYIQIAIASDYANGLGFDVNTGLVYGASGKNFIQLDEDGLVIDQGISFSKKVYRGDINENSQWYGVVGSDMVIINVSGTPQLTNTYPGEGLPGWDIAYNKDGNFYSIHNSTLYQFDTQTNTKSTIASLSGAGIPTSGGYGAQWTGSDGYLYASHNSTGKILRVNVENGESRIVSSSIDGLSKNDGFSCPLDIPAVYEFDYGDNARLPQSRVLSYYQDLSNDGLPDYSTVWLGNTVAYDSENPANNAADGDTDDGFSLNTRINEGMLYPQIGLNSNFETTCYYLFGIDWDDDGQFDHIETGSQQLNGAASLNIDLAVPQGFITGDVNIRILVSEESLSEADITGDVVAMGEVEDYRMKITSDEDCSNGIDDDGDGLTDCDDPDCSGIESCPVTPTGPGGGEGGLESNDRLSDKIAKVRFERTKSRAIDYNDKSILPILEKNSDYGKKIANRLAEGFGIEQFIPIDVLANSETYITSPIHLTDITNATEVFSADVFEGDNRVAAILALTSENGVYEHTKYVCDRLGGSVIEDVLTYKLDEEHDFQIAKMRLPSGNLEYATSFSASELDGAFAIESHWNLDYYTKEKSFYNFQIWSNTVQNLADLANETIRLLNVQMPVNSYDFGEAPEFFVNEASISSGILNLKTTNKGSYLNVEANGFYRNTETADRELFNESIQLNGEEKEEISVDLTGIYDLGLTFYHEKAAMPDVIFMADGAWGTDYDEATETIAEYKVSPGFTEGEEVYSLERDIRISGQVQESVAIFRSLDAVWRSKDVSAYNSLSFTASGAGRMEVTLVKSSISEWSEQPRVTIDLTDEKLSYQLSQAEFNGASGEEIKWNDIISVVFDIKGNGTSKEHFELELSNVAFRNQTVTNVWEEEATAVKVFPNPATDYLNLTFTSNHSGTYVISILDQSGKVVKSVFGHTNRGTQSVNIDDLPDQKGLYIYKIKLANKELATGKILIE